jgi:hypothetical protein
VDRHAEPVAIAGLGQKRLGGLGVVGIGLELVDKPKKPGGTMLRRAATRRP